MIRKKSMERYALPASVLLLVAVLLSMVQVKVDPPMLILERFVENGGWIEIALIAIYAAILVSKMLSPRHSARWRLISWNLFSAVFFLQLVLGLSGLESFLMTGELHLPVPMMIMGGPLYRGELSIMTALFISTVVLTGPAWCSHLCYFGALDHLAATRSEPAKGPLRRRSEIKFGMIFLIVFTIIILRWLNVPVLWATLIAARFGIAGILIILQSSTRQGRMVHCLTWCPVGTLVNYMRFINPFRMRIDRDSCTLCNRCSRHCRYDALNGGDIRSGSPGITCTLCGDCIQACEAGSIQYRFPGMKAKTARNFYLFLTVSFHAVFLAVARI